MFRRHADRIIAGQDLSTAPDFQVLIAFERFTPQVAEWPRGNKVSIDLLLALKSFVSQDRGRLNQPPKEQSENSVWCLTGCFFVLVCFGVFLQIANFEFRGEGEHNRFGVLSLYSFLLHCLKCLAAIHDRSSFTGSTSYPAGEQRILL